VKKESGMKILGQILKRINGGIVLAAMNGWKENRKNEITNGIQENAVERQKGFGIKSLARSWSRHVSQILRGILHLSIQDWKANTRHRLLEKTAVSHQRAGAVRQIRMVWSHLAAGDIVAYLAAWRTKQTQTARTDVVLSRKANEHQQASIQRSVAVQQFGRWMTRLDKVYISAMVKGWSASAIQDKADYEKRLAMWGNQNVLEQKARDDAQGAALKNMKAIMNRLIADGTRERLKVWHRAQRFENQAMTSDRQYSLQSEAEFKGKEGGLTLLKSIFGRFNHQNIGSMLALWRQRKMAQHRRLETQMRDALAFQNADNCKTAAFKELTYAMQRLTGHDIRKRLHKWRYIAVSEATRWSQFQAASGATVEIRKDIGTKEMARWILRLGSDLLRSTRIAATREWHSKMVAAKEEKRHVMRTTLAIVFGIRVLDNRDDAIREGFGAWQTNVAEERREEEMDQLRRRKVSLSACPVLPPPPLS